MSEKLAVKEFIKLAENNPVIDVRSRSEYLRGHIPGAVNLQLFTDEERHKIGIIYKQSGKEKAILKGLELVGPKLKDIAEQVMELAPDKRFLVHCWRGGMRSGSVAWLLELCGFKTFVLEGGYKQFRNFVLEQFACQRKLILLGGKTGSGKTEILKALEASGEQIIDLEELALHKGSAFGGYSQPETLTQEHFENELAFRLLSTDENKNTWLEDESRVIGRVHIPEHLWKVMRKAPVIFIDVPVERRVKNIVRGYGSYSPELLKGSVRQISKRLGGVGTTQALEFIENHQMERACELLLSYYDKAYLHALAKREHNNIFAFRVEETTESELTEKIREMAVKLPEEELSAAK